MLGAIIFVLLVLCAQSQSSVILKRQSLLFNEPPLDDNFIADKTITEHNITQPVDHFNHQDNRTFQMVKIVAFCIYWINKISFSTSWRFVHLFCSFPTEISHKWHPFPDRRTDFHIHRWRMGNRTGSHFAQTPYLRLGTRFQRIACIHWTSILWQNAAIPNGFHRRLEIFERRPGFGRLGEFRGNNHKRYKFECDGRRFCGRWFVFGNDGCMVSAEVSTFSERCLGIEWSIACQIELFRVHGNGWQEFS